LELSGYKEGSPRVSIILLLEPERLGGLLLFFVVDLGCGWGKSGSLRQFYASPTTFTT